MRALALLFACVFVVSTCYAQTLNVFDGKQPDDSRLGELVNLNGYFPFQRVENKDQWAERQREIKTRLSISQGLWPEPTKSELNAVVHGRVQYDDYVIDRVYFESIPGHFVTGSLYRPKGKTGPFPAVLCPHGHWRDARFYDVGEKAAKRLIVTGAERFVNAARNHLQARCVQLARMGCLAFFYDMTGNCDSVQLGHRPDNTDHLNRESDWGFFSVQADLRLHHMMGLQTWNSVRAIDFLLEQEDVDPQRIGVTGASGGGTQSMIIAAIDDRISAAMPCVMVSTAMQGGCTCENAPLMRIDQGNIDIAAAIAPRPLALTAADDWTRELETKGYPDLKNLYTMLGHQDRLTAVFHIHFPHNYNHVNRTVMYDFFNRHFSLGLETPVLESDFEIATKEQLTVWNEDHPAPTGDSIGDPHEVRILKIADADSREKISQLVPGHKDEVDEYQRVVGGAWKTIIARDISDVGSVKFTNARKVTNADMEIFGGRLTLESKGEQLPALKVSPVSNDPKGVVVWLSDGGKGDLFVGESLTSTAKPIQSDFTILTADLSGQGEFSLDGKAIERQPQWVQRDGKLTWHRFSGYTYGYNHTVFVRRVHDVLTLVKYAKEIAGSGEVRLIASGKNVGPVALAAISQSGDTIDASFVDAKGFAFEELTRHDDPMFVPGAVKYLGVDGLLSLCAPRNVTVTGVKGRVGATVYQWMGANESLRRVDDIWNSTAVAR